MPTPLRIVPDVVGTAASHALGKPPMTFLSPIAPAMGQSGADGSRVDRCRILMPRALTDAQLRCVGRRLSGYFLNLLFFCRAAWWDEAHRLMTDESLFRQRPPHPSSPCLENLFELERHRLCPATCRALRVFRRVTPDERLDIVRHLLWARPHPAAWYIHALFQVLRPGSRWALAPPPPWDINARWNEFPGDHGKTTLHWACMHSTAEVVAVLLAQGADARARTSYDETPLHGVVAHKACQSRRWNPEEDLRIADLLLDHGADVDAQNHRGESPLFAASRIEMAQRLIDAGASVTVKNRIGRTFAEYWDPARREVVQGPMKYRVDAHLLDRELVRATRVQAKRDRL